MLLPTPRYGELVLALMGVWVCWAKEVTPGLGLSWEGRPAFPPVLVLIVRDGVEYKAPPNPLEGVPLNWDQEHMWYPWTSGNRKSQGE